MEIMEFMVWVVELLSSEFFNGDKTVTYTMLKDYGLWDMYVQNYDITHTLGANCIISEFKDVMIVKGEK
jgi:hypothetical protein